MVTAIEDPEGKKIYVNREPYLTFGRTVARISRMGGLSFRQSLLEATGDLEAAEECHCRGYAMYRKGKVREALALFREALAHDPARALTRVDVGEILRQLGRPDEAMIHLRMALDVDRRRTGTSAQAYNIMGNTWVDMGRFNESLEEYNSCLSINPGFLPAYVNRGWAHYKIGNYEGAQKRPGKNLQTGPG